MHRPLFYLLMFDKCSEFILFAAAQVAFGECPMCFIPWLWLVGPVPMDLVNALAVVSPGIFHALAVAADGVPRESRNVFCRSVSMVGVVHLCGYAPFLDLSLRSGSGTSSGNQPQLRVMSNLNIYFS